MSYRGITRHQRSAPSPFFHLLVPHLSVVGPEISRPALLVRHSLPALLGRLAVRGAPGPEAVARIQRAQVQVRDVERLLVQDAHAARVQATGPGEGTQGLGEKETRGGRCLCWLLFDGPSPWAWEFAASPE